MISYEWRGRFENVEVNVLHAERFEHLVLDDDWWGQVNRHSFGWVCARQDAELVRLVNVAWDGACHAFVLDTLVAGTARRRGAGRELITEATHHVRRAGCEWLHVDFDEHLRPYVDIAEGAQVTVYDAPGMRVFSASPPPLVAVESR